MRRCARCTRYHTTEDSDVCSACWEELGQMSFWQDAEEVDDEVAPADDRHV